MKKIGILLIFISAFILLGVGVYLSLDTKKTPPLKISKNYTLEPITEISICKDKNNCRIQQDNYYKLIYNTDIEILNNIIKKINSDTNKYLEETKKEKANASSCQNVKDLYNYNKMIYTNYYIYQNKDLISITVKRTKEDLCTNFQKEEGSDVYIYSIASKKVLTQKEFRELLRIDDSKIQEAIEQDIKVQENLSMLPPTEQQEKTEDYQEKLFYNNDGNLLLTYKYNNLVYTTTFINE